MEVAIMALVSLVMCAATGLGWWSIGWMEVGGFVTGGICVWLTVREHLWTWPIGLANNLVFLVLFWRERLFADAVLQVVYFVLGVYGWWNWVQGGARRTELTVSRAPRMELLVLIATVPLATLSLREILITVNGAAPFWDSLTTVLSLVAQIMMCRKRLEHWLFWMVADVIYIPLYVSRNLPLTAMLYFVFLLMCIAGWRMWISHWRSVAAGVAK